MNTEHESIYGTALGSPTPPGGCGWVGMLVDGVVVFANDVESYGICKELY